MTGVVTGKLTRMDGSVVVYKKKPIPGCEDRFPEASIMYDFVELDTNTPWTVSYQLALSGTYADAMGSPEDWLPGGKMFRESA